MSAHPVIPGFSDCTVFRALFAAYPDALLLVDLQGQIVLANPAAIELLGYSAEAFCGLPVDELVPDGIRPRHAAYREAYAAHPRARPMGTHMELVAKRCDGSEVMVEIALSPLQERGLPYIVAAVRGVGAYPHVKQAFQRARYAECLAQFGRSAVNAREPQAVLRQVPAMAAEALEVESAAVLILEPDELDFRIAAGIGMAAGEYVGGLLPNQPTLPAGQVVATGQAVIASAGSREGAHWPSELAVPLSDCGRTIGVLSARSRIAGRFSDHEGRFLGSLSNLLSTVLQRAKSEEALSHAQRLESIGQLTGGIAHDFNNLLTVISGNLQMLEGMPVCATDGHIRQLVDAASRATRRGSELTEKLLAFSRRQVLQASVLDISELLSSLTDMLRRTLDQRIIITLEAEALLCLADPIQLESALLNIAINARDAMPGGGVLAFVCRAQATLPDELMDPGVEPNEAGYVRIAVTDTGAGMTKAVKAHAFEPFFTTKESGRGTGLGLSTVYGFARQSHGAVALQSEPGKGTTVTLYLPQVRAEGGREPRQPSEPDHEFPTGLRILLVEDDCELRYVIERFLASMQCKVEFRATAEEALRLLESDIAFDLLLSDIALGAGMRGIELAELVRERSPALPILLMSGFSGELIGSLRGWSFLRKPCTCMELRYAIATALRPPC